MIRLIALAGISWSVGRRLFPSKSLGAAAQAGHEWPVCVLAERPFAKLVAESVGGA
jgi:hypothetical protein